MSDYYAQTWAAIAAAIAAALDAGHGLRVTLGDGMSAYVPAEDLEAEWDYLNLGETFDVTPCALCEAGESQIHNYEMRAECYHNDTEPWDEPDTDGCTIYVCLTCGERWNSQEPFYAYLTTETGETA